MHDVLLSSGKELRRVLKVIDGSLKSDSNSVDGRSNGADRYTPTRGTQPRDSLPPSIPAAMPSKLSHHFGRVSISLS